MFPAAKGPAGPASLPVGRGWHDRPHCVSRLGAARPQDRGRLAAAGCWRLQAGPYCDAGPSRAQPAPAAGTRPTLRHLGLTGSPHQPRRGQRQRLGRFLRVPFSVSVSPSMFARRYAEQRSLRKRWRRSGRGPAGPCAFKRFST